MNIDLKNIKFDRNVGNQDQKIRYGIGAVLILIAIIKGIILLLLLGIILVASAYLTWCPVYTALGKNTCGTDPGSS